jgi:hypothetical protein
MTSGNDIAVNGAGDNDRFRLYDAFPEAALCQCDRTINIALTFNLTIHHEMAVTGQKTFHLAPFADQGSRTAGRIAQTAFV